MSPGSGPGGRWFKSTRPDHLFSRRYDNWRPLKVAPLVSVQVLYCRFPRKLIRFDSKATRRLSQDCLQTWLRGPQCTEDALLIPFRFELTSQAAARFSFSQRVSPVEACPQTTDTGRPAKTRSRLMLWPELDSNQRPSGYER